MTQYYIESVEVWEKWTGKEFVDLLDDMPAKFFDSYEAAEKEAEKIKRDTIIVED